MYQLATTLIISGLSICTSTFFHVAKLKKSGLEEPETYLALEMKPDFLNQILE